MKKVINNESYEILKSSGHVVPRDNNGNVITFKVSGIYTVTSKDNPEPIKVKCTQNSPYHLKTIE